MPYYQLQQHKLKPSNVLGAEIRKAREKMLSMTFDPGQLPERFRLQGIIDALTWVREEKFPAPVHQHPSRDHIRRKL